VNLIGLFTLIFLVFSCSFGGYLVKEEYNQDIGLGMEEVIVKRGVTNNKIEIEENGKLFKYHSYKIEDSRCIITYKYFKGKVEDIVYTNCPKKLGGIRLKNISIGNHHPHTH